MDKKTRDKVYDKKNIPVDQHSKPHCHGWILMKLNWQADLLHLLQKGIQHWPVTIALLLGDQIQSISII